MSKTSVDLWKDSLDRQVEDALDCIKAFDPEDNETRLQLECCLKELLDECRKYHDTRSKRVSGAADQVLSRHDLTNEFLAGIHMKLQLSII